MRRAGLIVAAAMVALGGLAGTASASPPPQANIIGGSEVPDGKYPFMASLQYQDDKGNWGHFCGASLIDARGILLTAGHCGRVIEQVKVRAVVGRTKLSGEDGYIRGIREVKVHKDADVALIFLDDEVADVAPIQLVTPGTDALERPGRNVLTTGWGSTVLDPAGPGGGGPGSYQPDRLREVTVPIVSNDECSVSFPGLDTTYSICAGRHGKDACQGDSGGPLFVKAPSGRFIQLGVTSAGAGCGALGYPGIYAKLSTQEVGDWIANFGMDTK
ncbi:trypsin-like serine protease [Amycolatopsis sp. cg5]|uniref:S1 family peptidase n=1 Tax=Amycolatopsis sp. cg5 TaxID=3238802 RepID=UPI0035265C62